MTTQEFSDKFDVLLNSYSYLEPHGLTQNIRTLKLDEYEKSIYLTLAQDEVIKQLYPLYERDENARRRLHSLVTEITQSSSVQTGLTDNSYSFDTPEDLMYIVYERIKLTGAICKVGANLTVVPVKHDHFNKDIHNPFRRPKLNGRYNVAWRLDSPTDYLEIIVPEGVVSFDYTYRYIRNPRPIILDDLSATVLSIKGQKLQQTSEMNDINHEEILQIAVNKALSVIAKQSVGEQN